MSWNIFISVLPDCFNLCLCSENLVTSHVSVPLAFKSTTHNIVAASVFKMTNSGESNGVEYQTMTADRAVDSVEVLRNGFFSDESFCIATGVDEDPASQRELENLAVDCARDGVSIMAVEKNSGKIVGVSYNKYQTAPPPGQKSYFEKFRDSRCETKAAIGLINEMLWFDSQVDLYDKYKVNCSLELMFLSTHKDYRRRGIAAGCVEASLALARSLPSSSCSMLPPPLVTAIFTSPFSARVGRTLQFDEVIHVSYQHKSFAGKPFCDNPKVGRDHPGAVVMAKIL